MQAQPTGRTPLQANVNVTHARRAWGFRPSVESTGRVPAGTDGSKIVLVRWVFVCSDLVAAGCWFDDRQIYQRPDFSLSRPPGDGKRPCSRYRFLLEILRFASGADRLSGFGSSVLLAVFKSDYAAAAADCRSSRRCEWRVVGRVLGFDASARGICMYGWFDLTPSISPSGQWGRRSTDVC